MIASTALALTLTALSVQAAPALELTVGAAESVTGVDNFAVDITLTNTGDEVLKLYNDPRGPLNSFPEHTFSVADADGQATPFIGAHVKYSFDRATSFTTLAPTESVTVTHTLAQAYNFTHVGAYSVSFEPLFHYQSAEGTAVPIIATTASTVDSIEKGVDVAEASTDVTFSIELTGSLVSTQRNQISARSISGLQKRASFVSCSSSRTSSINSALGVVPTYLSNGLSYLSTAGSSSTRYRTWFGTYSSANDNTVTSHFSAIQSSNPSTYTYNCGCTDDYYAYVYPSQFGYVYLCNAFWTAPTSGTDSKAGTIVHEASHFTRNGGTNDYAYGQSAAKSLANSNPSRAIMNADSHEYFVENTPSLP